MIGSRRLDVYHGRSGRKWVVEEALEELVTHLKASAAETVGCGGADEGDADRQRTLHITPAEGGGGAPIRLCD